MKNRAPQSQSYTLFMLVLQIAFTVFSAIMSVIEQAHRYGWLFLVCIGLVGIMSQYRIWYRVRFFKP